MKDHINAIIIGVAIVIAAVLIVRSLPRYQYGEHVVSENLDGATSETTEAYVFDMVTGKKYTHSFWMFIPANANAQETRTRTKSWKEPKHSVLETWTKQREVFGTEMVDGKKWKAWKDAHPEW